MATLYDDPDGRRHDFTAKYAPIVWKPDTLLYGSRATRQRADTIDVGANSWYTYLLTEHGTGQGLLLTPPHMTRSTYGCLPDVLLPEQNAFQVGPGRH